MFKHFLTIARRRLLKNRMSTLINIGGLSIGMSIVILIGLYIWDEVTFDHYHLNHQMLTQVMTNQRYNGQTETMSRVAVPSAEELRTRYASAFDHVALVSRSKDDHIVVWGDKKLSQSGYWVEQDFPEMFTLDMIEGQRNALTDPSSILISRSAATALFGNTDPLNKTVRVDDQLDFRIAGVYADLPRNTTFYGTQILLPWKNKGNYANTSTDWENHKALLFVQSKVTQNESNLNDRIRKVPTPHIKGIEEEFLLQPLDRLHLYSQFENGRATGGLISYVWLFGMIGVFVLLLACINFMNLSTARSEKRAKEVAIRKTLGSVRLKLVIQFLVESVAAASLSFILALLISGLLLPYFNGLSQKNLSLPWSSTSFWLTAIGFTVLTGLVAGSYPALYLSRFKPVKILKGTAGIAAGNFTFLLRRSLVILQFTVSITLCIGTIIVYRQIQYAKDRPAGYSVSNLLTVPVNTPDLRNHYDAIRNELLSTGAATNMAESSYPTTHFDSENGMDWEGRDPNLAVGFRNVNVTRDFGHTIGWNILKGRDFSKDFSADSAAAILNEAAANVIGFKDPIGRRVRFDGIAYTIVGVVKNMVTQSPYEPADPSVFFCGGGGYLGTITIRVNPDAPLNTSMAKTEAIFRKYNPSSPFLYSFNDEEYGKKFQSEERIGKLTTSFSLLAILISCLGLFGLASFLAEQRTREVGIRKVLGASVFNLWALLSKEFVALVLLSLVIATPVAWYFMHHWLLNYAYRTQPSPWIFALSGLGALLITLLTVSFQAVRAAAANPVRSLRNSLP
jgi:putative ABC transport system permease protein